MATTAPENETSRPNSRFATFFRNYGVALSLIVAAIPVLTSYFG